MQNLLQNLEQLLQPAEVKIGFDMEVLDAICALEYIQDLKQTVIWACRVINRLRKAGTKVWI